MTNRTLRHCDRYRRLQNAQTYRLNLAATDTEKGFWLRKIARTQQAHIDFRRKALSPEGLRRDIARELLRQADRLERDQEARAK